MRDAYDPLPGAEGWQLSNPPILPLAALRASLEIFDEATMDVLRQKSLVLTDALDSGIRALEHPSLEIFTPQEAGQRGCQISLYVRRNGKRLFQFLSQNGVIADWREPDVIRMAPVPLYNTPDDVERFLEVLKSGLGEISVA
jgi:kynureninase